MTVARLEVLVEERSMAQALNVLLPKICPGIEFEIRDFNGKSDLLKKLPSRLKGYTHWIGASKTGVIVVVDRDNDDCRVLKANLLKIAGEAGLTVHSCSLKQDGEVLNRIAIEELEAWFFGDVAAIVTAYPGVPDTLASRAKFRDPDAISGGTWESLERVLQEAGYHPGGLRKTVAARDISRHMDVDTNGSRSFQMFRDGVRSLVAQGENA